MAGCNLIHDNDVGPELYFTILLSTENEQLGPYLMNPNSETDACLIWLSPDRYWVVAISLTYLSGLASTTADGQTRVGKHIP